MRVWSENGCEENPCPGKACKERSCLLKERCERVFSAKRVDNKEGPSCVLGHHGAVAVAHRASEGACIVREQGHVLQGQAALAKALIGFPLKAKPQDNVSGNGGCVVNPAGMTALEGEDVVCIDQGVDAIDVLALANLR